MEEASRGSPGQGEASTRIECERLYGLPLEEFVPARDTLVKELRRSGDKEAVEAVKRLRKPSLAAWALNQAARRHPDEVGRLLEVGAALREAQHEALAGDAGRLREAGRELGQAVERVADLAAAELTGAGREASNAQRERILATLRAAAAHEDGGDLLRRGVLVADLEPTGFGLGGLDAAAPARAERRSAERQPGKASPEAQEAVEAARRDLRRAEAEAGAAESRARRRAERAEAAARRAAETHQEAEAARAKAEEAADEAAAARRRAREAAGRLEEAEASALRVAETIGLELDAASPASLPRPVPARSWPPRSSG